LNMPDGVLERVNTKLRRTATDLTSPERNLPLR
jgi:hypothetical protein